MKQIKLRLQDDLHLQITQAARSRGVSLNAEINARVKSNTTDRQAITLLEEILARLDEMLRRAKPGGKP